MQIKYGRTPATSPEEVTKSGATRFNNLFLDNTDNFLLKRKDKAGAVFTVNTAHSTREQYTCGETIAGGRAIALINGLIWHFQPSNPAHVGMCIGISVQAGEQNSAIEIAIKGYLENLGNYLTPSLPVYSGDNGVLTQIEPTTGILQAVGIATNTGAMFIDIAPCFILTNS